MKSIRNKATKVGIFVFGAIAVLVLTIYFIGSKDNLFASKMNVICTFQDIRGVVVGNNVRFSGINVGTVRSIEMTSDSTVVLTLSIADKYAKHIYKNSIVEISQDGLMGSKLLNISSGTASSGLIEEGDRLHAKYGVDLEGMLSEARDILYQAGEAVTSLKSIAGKIDTGDGDIGRLINDNTLTTELVTTTRSLNSTLANVDQITRKINTGQGDLARLINGNELTDNTYSVLGNLNEAAGKTNKVVSDLAATTNSINSGEGTVNMLLNSKKTAQNIDTAILKLQNSLEEFDKTAQAIQESWIVRLFSKKKKKNSGNTVVMDSIR